MSQQARGYCAVAISIPLTCSAEIKPSAFVKEKCVSAFEFNRMMPSPSSRSGGITMGKTLAHRSASVERVRRMEQCEVHLWQSYHRVLRSQDRFEHQRCCCHADPIAQVVRWVNLAECRAGCPGEDGAFQWV